MLNCYFSMGKRGPQPIASRLTLVTTAYSIYGEFCAMSKGARRGVFVRKVDSAEFARGAAIPGEPRTIAALFEAQTVKQVRAICQNSAWMAKQPHSYVSRCLPTFAKQFLNAKADRHFPNSDRISSTEKRLWFVARFLAGALYGLSGRRSMNLIGPGRAEEIGVMLDDLSNFLPSLRITHASLLRKTPFQARRSTKLRASRASI